MTTITVKRQQNSIIQVECKGHSGYAEKNKDIVCAGISSITQTALLGLLKVAKVKVDYKADEETGYLMFKIVEDLDEAKRRECDAILETMLVGIKDLQDGFSKYIKVEDK